MRHIKYIILLLYSIIGLNVYANACSYQEQTILNNDFSNVKITYEIVNDNKINILIYNITDNIYISFKEPNAREEENVFYVNTNNGKYVIEKTAEILEEYSFKIRSNISSCYGKILTTKNIIKPKYNEYHTLEICKNKQLTNHSYCQKFITSDINKSQNEVIKTLEEYQQVRVEKITTKKVIEESNIDIKKVITYSSIGLLVIASVVILILIKKKRGEL